MNGTQADGTQDDDTLDDETLADGDGSDGPDVEKLRRLRLSGFLRDLVRQEGKMEAAELPGVNHKTLTRAEESGEITGRMGDALELLLRKADDAEIARLGERMTTLEAGMEALRKELRDGLDGLRAAVAGGEPEAGGGDQPQAQDGERGEGAGRSETRPPPPVAGLRPKKPFTERRLDPEVVAEEAADDDP